MDSAACGHIPVVATSMSSVPVDQTLHDDGSRVKAWLSGVDWSSLPNTELAPVILLLMGVRPTPWGEWALDTYHHDQIGHHSGPAGLHVPCASEATLDCETTEQYSQRRIDCESCCATVTQLNSDLLPPGANL